MQIIINAVPQFNFQLSSQQIDVLVLASQTHDDRTCRDASRPYGIAGADPRATFGILSLWCRRINDQEIASNTAVITATHPQLDLCTKILENTLTFTPDQRSIASELSLTFGKAMVAAANAAPTWDLTV